MSLREDLAEALAGIEAVDLFTVNKAAELHGEDAITVLVVLDDGRTVEGTFTTETKPGFGGVDFDNRKDIPKLMRSKVESVLAGTADLT